MCRNNTRHKLQVHILRICWLKIPYPPFGEYIWSMSLPKCQIVRYVGAFVNLMSVFVRRHLTVFKGIFSICPDMLEKQETVLVAWMWKKFLFELSQLRTRPEASEGTVASLCSQHPHVFTLSRGHLHIAMTAKACVIKMLLRAWERSSTCRFISSLSFWVFCMCEFAQKPRICHIPADTRHTGWKSAGCCSAGSAYFPWNDLQRNCRYLQG